MIEIRLHDQYTIRIDGAIARHGREITTIPNREFIKRGNAWLVPLSRLGYIIKIVGPQDVSIDYDVLRARDAQLRRIVDQYAACGIAIWNDGGALRTDNDLLTSVLQPIAALLLDWLPTQPQRRVRAVRTVQYVGEVDKGLESWLAGVKNAAADDEKQQKRRAKWTSRRS